MASQKDILRTLTKARLLELAAAFEVDGLSGKPKAAVVEALARSRQVAVEDVLAELYRDELKNACRALGIDDSGRAKQPIIDRLLSAQSHGEPASNGRRSRSAPDRDNGGRRNTKKRTSSETRSMAKKKSGNKRAIEQYDHSDKQRVNNPPVGLVTPQTDPDKPERKQYQYDPHLDPQLVWAGKAERTSFEVPSRRRVMSRWRGRERR